MGTHHGDVGIGDGQDEGGAKGRRSHDAEGLAVILEVGHGSSGDDGVGGQEGGQVSLHTNRSHAWAAAPMGDAEGLVQVQMAHIRPDVSRRGQANLSPINKVRSIDKGTGRGVPALKARASVWVAGQKEY